VPTVTDTTVVLADTRDAQAAKVIGAQLAPGVTPRQAQTVLITTIATQAVAAAQTRRRK
jgi:hypothetical protein